MPGNAHWAHKAAVAPPGLVAPVSVATAGVSATTMTLPAHIADDVIYIVAMNTAGGVAITPGTAPAGWTKEVESVSGNRAIALFRRVATGAGTTATGFTNATRLEAWIFRGADTADPVGHAVPTTAGTSVSFTIAALTLEHTGGTSWVCAAGFTKVIDTSTVVDSATPSPAGLQRRLGGQINSTNTYGKWDSNGAVPAGSSFAARTIADGVNGAAMSSISFEVRGKVGLPPGPGFSTDIVLLEDTMEDGVATVDLTYNLVGDVILYAGFTASLNLPAIPTGFTNILTRDLDLASTDYSMRIAYRVTTEDNEDVSGIGGVSGIRSVVSVWRGVHPTNLIGANASGGSNVNVTTINLPNITPEERDVVVSIIFNNSDAPSLPSGHIDMGSGSPAGLGYRHSYIISPASYTGRTATQSSGNYLVATIELRST